MPARVVQQLIRDARLLDANPRCCSGFQFVLLRIRILLSIHSHACECVK